MRRVEAVVRDHDRRLLMTQVSPTLASTFVDGDRVVIVDADEFAAMEAKANDVKHVEWEDACRLEREAGRVEAAEAIAAWLMSERFAYNDHYPRDISMILRNSNDWRAHLPPNEKAKP